MVMQDDGFVELLSTGDSAKGEYHCSACGYGVAVCAALPPCPMCGGETWQQTPWSPFTRNAVAAAADET